MHKSIGLFMLGLVLASPTWASDEEHWIGDFDKAVAVAKKEGKHLLVDFTGSDWCGWCIKLHEEVFSHEAFLTAAQKQFVLVSLDFPRGPAAKAKVPNPARNDELMRKYGIQGFPTVLLMTPAGDIYGRTGYKPGGPEAYLAHLKQTRDEGMAALAPVLAIVKEFRTAADAASKSAAFEKALRKFERMPAGGIGLGSLAEVIRAAFVFDADNAKGLKRRAIDALMKAHIFDRQISTAVRSIDPGNEQGLLEKAVEAQVGSVKSIDALKLALEAIGALDKLGIKDRELAKRLYVNAAFWNFRHLKENEAAKTWAKKAQALGVENPQFKELIEQILGS